MTTATRSRRAEPPEVSTYVSGWHTGGLDDRCVGVYAGTVCAHPYHRTPVGGEGVHTAPTAGEGHPEGPDPAAPGAPAPSPRSIAAVTEDVEALSREVAQLLDGLAEIEALDLLAGVRQARIALAQIECVVEGRAARLMTGNTVEWPGGVAMRHWGRDRKEWRHDEWQADVRKQVRSGVPVLLVNPDSGEQVDVDVLLQGCQNVHGAGAPKSTALRALGLSPDDYCTSVPGRASIEIVPAGSA